MLISYNRSLAKGFLRWSNSHPKKGNDNHPAESAPVSLAGPLTIEPGPSPDTPTGLEQEGA